MSKVEFLRSNAKEPRKAPIREIDSVELKVRAIRVRPFFRFRLRFRHHLFSFSSRSVSFSFPFSFPFSL